MNDMSFLQPVQKYWDWRAESFDATSCRDEPWVNIFAGAVDLPPGSRILDAGTGTGFLALGLAKKGFKVTGIDISANMLEIAGKKARDMGLDVDFSRSGADDPPFAPGSFDAVVARNLLWTLKYPEDTLKNWAGLLRSGGRLVVSDGIWRPVSFLQKRFDSARELLQRFKKNRLIHPEVFKRMYKEVDQDLPFGCGLSLSQAEKLLTGCGYVSLMSHEHKFQVNPYTVQGELFPGYGRFFILSASTA